MSDDFRPLYSQQFRCIGPDCEDNCCHGWGVLVDRASYQKYHQLPALSPLVSQHFVLVTDHPAENRHAIIQTDVHSNCPLLGEDRLCTLQKQYGEDYLCKTCATYPRAQTEVAGEIENPLLLSCPEAARLVLLNPDLMPALPSNSVPHRYSRFLDLPDAGGPVRSNPVHYLSDIREFTLILLTDRSYPLWQRLFLLGNLCRQLDEIFLACESGLVPRLLCEYAVVIAEGALRSSMDAIPERPLLQVNMVLAVVRDGLAPTNPLLCSLHECLRDFLEGLQSDSTSNLEVCAERYQEAHLNYYAPFMRKHPFLLENYLINHIFRTGFPFGSDPDNCRPQREFIWMCVEFALIKGFVDWNRGTASRRICQ